mmetsp:Transcript_27005/g.26637  ORF Transcript_27005/g.26637 Transcript_27005/m.26637 type:complete len:485 (+) Transcript_27005:321-1775(+)
MAKYEPNSQEPCYVVQLLNSFTHKGPHGKHVCMVFEILGVNLLEIIKVYKYKGVPMHICRRISKQVLIGLDYLHRICGLIHTDLKPENVLVQLTQAQINEILVKGQLFNKISYSKALETPETEITPQIFFSLEEQQEIEKRNKLKEKRKKYRQRKKEKAKLMKNEEKTAETNVVETKKKRKRNRKKKNLESEIEINMESKNESTKSSINEDKNEIEEGVCEDINIKIADLGNACWVHKHYSTEIQTRQYRSPEVILGINYNTTADLWSFACMLFELLTGDFLFDPRSGSDFEKDDDHLAQMIETLGLIPKDWALSGLEGKKFFDKSGRLKGIYSLKIWLLKDVLVQKYRFIPQEAEDLASFLLPMLRFKPEERASAQECLAHPWLTKEKREEIHLSDEEYDKLMNELEEKRLAIIERIESGEYVSSPDVPRELSAIDADSEDNDSEIDSWSEEEPENEIFKENEEYHNRMILMKREALGIRCKE